MDLLLDTCALIWLTSDPSHISPTAKSAIDHPDSRLHVSHASLWEIVLKHQTGKLSLPESPRQWWLSQINRWLFVEIPLNAEVILRSSELPQHHKDPFDRIIIAQSLMLNRPVLSPDRHFPAYGAKIVW